MYYVYLLKSNKDNGLYIGCTGDLQKRFSEHMHGKVEATKNRRPLELIYYEAYDAKELMIKRERQLKCFGSAYYGLVKRIIRK